VVGAAEPASQAEATGAVAVEEDTPTRGEGATEDPFSEAGDAIPDADDAVADTDADESDGHSEGTRS